MKYVAPRVSIIIPCRNEVAHITSCVCSILEQEPPPGGFEVIVADGMSDDGTREILTRLKESDGRLRLVDNPGRTVPVGLNIAIRIARGKIIIRMDAHTEYASDYICQCQKILEMTGADNVGGPARTKSESYVQRAICAAYHSPFSVGGARFHNIDYEGYVDTVPYGCWHREIFDRIGFFDEELVRNQDDEFNLRIARVGGKIWQSPEIQSWYMPRHTLRRLFQQYLQYGYWKVRVIQKHKYPASIRHLIPACFVFLLMLLPLLSFKWPIAGWGWLGLVGTYTIVNQTVSVLTLVRNGWKILPILPIVFGCFHFAYGWGFLHGIWDFVILRRFGGTTYTKLTRGINDSR